MLGYCQECKINVDVKTGDGQTIKLPNLNYVHKGKCPSCGGPVFRKVQDKDLIVNASGHRFPKTVFVGPNTPKRLVEDENGQILITNAGQTYQTRVKDGQDIITLEDIKQRIKERKT
jgi:hypothetical protein